MEAQTFRAALDQGALRAATEAYKIARVDLRAARAQTNAVWTRLQASPDTLEYQIGWSTARRHEAAAASHLVDTERAYVSAGGYARSDPEE